MFRLYCFLLLLCLPHYLCAQQHELNTGWKCIRAADLNKSGDTISQTTYLLNGWLPAIVPGTVLANQRFNKQIPDPFYGMNNKLIPDIYTTGRDYYTYWFATDFNEPPRASAEEEYIIFRGVNYCFDAWLNGHKLNEKPDSGMFLRNSYNITKYLAKGGVNRLAVIVYPPSPVGNPNGGQGGDGMIAHSVTNQYVAGWDWIQPVPDRNTGIWDKVFIKRTGQLQIEDPHIVTLVPGKRFAEGKQLPATLKVSAEIENTADTMLKGVLVYELDGKTVSTDVRLEPHSLEEVHLPDFQLENPKLWWPNGYGKQYLYKIKLRLLVNKKVADEETINFGVRQITTVWNAKTRSREIRVNGQKIFIKGGNWILSDELLRFTNERYDAEVHYHHEMNLNLLRVWGGGITERPEFYDACDKYGLLVMQDFWVSGDCNGRWYDPLKLEDTVARRKYPDDHNLFIASLEDQIKLLRNHPSLALWCGGNEIRPPADILTQLRDTLLPELDGTHYLFEYSNDDSMSLHGGDGPYTIQPTGYFWQHKSFPFNSEIGSVGIGDPESLEKFIPAENLIPPCYSQQQKKWIVDTVWQYHKYIGYDSSIEAYGHPTDIHDFCRKAQLVNYDQYRALMEGATSRMWDWYTGIIIWKTQNPWTAMRGQLYDYYLDPNAGMFGTMEGSKPLHIMYDPVKRRVLVANNLFMPTQKICVTKIIYTLEDNGFMVMQHDPIQVGAFKIYAFDSIGIDFAGQGGLFQLSITDSATGVLLDENTYWYPNKEGNYPFLSDINTATPTIEAIKKYSGLIEVTISDNFYNNQLIYSPSFFVNVSLVNPTTGKRILPVFYSDNYISVFRGEKRKITLRYNECAGIVPKLCVEGWNVKKQYFDISPE